MKYLLGLVCALGCITIVNAQNLRGKITDKEQQPLVGANIFIRETLQGVATSVDGEFQLFLPAGNYTCEVSSIGYVKQIVNVRVIDTPVYLEIVLQPIVYMLPEVIVTDKDEDPAYYVMRKAIARAPFHRNQVKRYTAEVYTKGNAKVDKIPKLFLLGATSEERKEINSFIGKLLVLESVTEVKFEAPDNYEDKVLAFTSTIPEEMDPRDALGIITASIYEQSFMGMVSPLSPGAFSQYYFRFTDSYMEDGKVIYKIRVIPKSKNSQLFSGELYIEDRGWSVVNFDLSAEVLNSKFNFKTIFHELLDGVYLPTSYNIDVDLKLMGVIAVGKYFSSLKYSDIDAVKEAREIIDLVKPEENKPVSERQKKTIKKLEDLTRKENLSTKEAYQVAKLTQQALEESFRGDSIHPLDIRPLGTNRVEVDSLATLRDSLFWQQYRTLPLNTEERASYNVRDSIWEIIPPGSIDSQGGVKESTSIMGKLLLGGSFWTKNKVSLRIKGLLGACPEYNFVDGFWLGQRFDLYYKFAEQRRLQLQARIHYATARKTWVWNTEFIFPYALKNNGKFSIGVGDISMDYKQETGAIRVENSLTSLTYGHNLLKFYRNQYYQFSNEVDVINGLRVNVKGEYQERTPLKNEISYNLFKKTINSNGLDSQYMMPAHHSARLSAGISYNPRAYYRMEGKRKYYVETSWPTFSINYTGGFRLGDATSEFHRMEVSVKQAFDISVFNKMSYTVFGGKHFSAKEIYYPDYKHFSSSGWMLNYDGFERNFFVGEFYDLATDKEWLGAALNFNSPYLFFKNIPEMQHQPFDEALHLRYLWTPAVKNYLEVGYTIGMGNTMRFGIFVGFEKMKDRSVGCRITIPLP